MMILSSNPFEAVLPAPANFTRYNNNVILNLAEKPGEGPYDATVLAAACAGSEIKPAHTAVSALPDDIACAS